MHKNRILILILFLIVFLNNNVFANGINLIENGSFDDGLSSWDTIGDVTIENNCPIAEVQGMDDNFALLGLNQSNGNSSLSQNFNVTGISKLTITFNWFFDYWDNSSSADDTFISFISQNDSENSLRISMLDLQTEGTGFFSPDFECAYGSFTKEFDISSYTNNDAVVVFSLLEESDSRWLRGTASVAGIDNIGIYNSNLPVPEPTSFILLGTGLFGFAAIGRKKKFKR